MRNTDLTWAYAGLLAIAGIAVVQAAGKCTAWIDAGDKVLFLGDSLMVGKGKYFKVLAKEHGCDSLVLAKEGSTIPNWINSADLKKALSSFRPTKVIISLGTNDSRAASWTKEQHRVNALTLLSMLQQAGAQSFWILPPTLPFSNGDAGLSEVIESTGVPSFNSKRLAIPRGPDNLHPTLQGYAGWAGQVWKQLVCGAKPQALQGAPVLLRRRMVVVPTKKMDEKIVDGLMAKRTAMLGEKPLRRSTGVRVVRKS